MRVRFLIILFSFSIFSADAQVWDAIKEKAKSAWNSDTRKKAWEKTKEYAGKAKEVSEKVLEPYSYFVPITNRSFVNVVPDEQMDEMGLSQYKSYLRNATLSKNAQKTAQMKRVTNCLINAVNEFYDNNGLENTFQWEFKLVQNSEANAWCLPGGKIVVYDGILQYAKDDASLAIVIGHEIAHAIAKHSAEQMTKGLISTVGVSALYLMISNSDMSSTKKALSMAIASAGVTLSTLKFSRVDETEADRIGLIITAMAGYNPEVAIDFWQRMGQVSKNKSTHDWYSTHPSNTNRIANIKSFLPEALEYYQQSH